MSELGYYAFKEASKHKDYILIAHAHGAACQFSLKRIIRLYFKKSIRKYTTYMFVCSIKVGNWMFGKHNRNKFIMMNNAIKTNEFLYSDKNRFLKRQELGIREDQFVLGHVGRLTYPKNHSFLLEIFRTVKNRIDNAVLLLVGKGELEKELRYKAKKLGIEKDVIFAGIREDVNKIYSAMDVFVFPSISEGLPVSVVEAQASGLPCILSDAITTQVKLTDLVQYLSLTTSTDVWAEKILDIKLNKNINCRKKDMKDIIKKSGFDIESNAKWLEEFYLNCYEKRRYDYSTDTFI